MNDEPKCHTCGKKIQKQDEDVRVVLPHLFYFCSLQCHLEWKKPREKHRQEAIEWMRREVSKRGISREEERYLNG